MPKSKECFFNQFTKVYNIISFNNKYKDKILIFLIK